jgi:hypothetical protein
LLHIVVHGATLMAASLDEPTVQYRPKDGRWWIYFPWVALVLLYASLAGMLHFRVAHPHFLPVVSLAALLLIASLVAVLAGFWRLLRGPRRLHGLRLLCVASVPLAVVAFHGSWANSRELTELRFAGYRLRILLPLAESVMDLEARWRYPQRTEGRKVVMIHAGIANAPELVQAMDSHVERMERLLGYETKGKVHWVRGGLLGQEQKCLFGIALGSEPGAQGCGPDRLTSLDRHEVAHWAINGLLSPYQQTPPPILIEGWAEAQSGYSPSELYSHGARYREDGFWVPLKELILPDHEDFGLRIYSQGGVLVDYLLARHGGPAFFALYNDCTALTFESDCRRHLNQDLEDLETAYAQHLDNTIARHGTLSQWRLQEMHCGPNVDVSKWQAFVHKYVAMVRPQLEPNARFSVMSKYKSLRPPLSQGDLQINFALSGPFASRMEKSVAAQTLSLAHPSGSWQMHRESSVKPWVAQPLNTDSERAYKSHLRSLRQQARDWLQPSLFDASFWSRVDADLAIVTELAEFGEAGEPRVRVTIQLPEHRGVLPRQTTILALDQGYLPIFIEEQNLFSSEAHTTRLRREYGQVEGQFLLRQQFGETTTPEGQVVSEFSTEIKDCKLGAIPPEQFTLKSLGVDESEIVVQPSVVSESNKASWQKRLPWWIAGWILFCLCVCSLVTYVSFRGRQAGR